MNHFEAFLLRAVSVDVLRLWIVYGGVDALRVFHAMNLRADRLDGSSR